MIKWMNDKIYTTSPLTNPQPNSNTTLPFPSTTLTTQLKNPYLGTPSPTAQTTPTAQSAHTALDNDPSHSTKHTHRHEVTTSHTAIDTPTDTR